MFEPKFTINVLISVIATALLLPSLAWGQLRVRSGALKSGIEHPKALETRVFNLTNEVRRKNGLPLLDEDSSLASQARDRSDELVKSHPLEKAVQSQDKKIKHYDKEEPARIGYKVGPGENIQMGYKDDYSDVETAARLIVNGFMGAPPLRNNILNPAFSHLGVGVSIQGKESYIILEFGPKPKLFPGIIQKSGDK